MKMKVSSISASQLKPAPRLGIGPRRRDGRPPAPERTSSDCRLLLSNVARATFRLGAPQRMKATLRLQIVAGRDGGDRPPADVVAFPTGGTHVLAAVHCHGSGLPTSPHPAGLPNSSSSPRRSRPVLSPFFGDKRCVLWIGIHGGECARFRQPLVLCMLRVGYPCNCANADLGLSTARAARPPVTRG
jgi:hypothetical protein